ncbi:MAG: 1-deoxy-D-xylulose-5-phosphate reductoisomerase [Pseudomonadota bacterium]
MADTIKRLTILGSTGSIGRNALRIVEQYPDRFAVACLAAGKNIELLAQQIRKFRPCLAVVMDKDCAMRLSRLLPSDGAIPEIAFGLEGYKSAAVLAEANTIVSALVGSSGLIPTLVAVEAGKRVALANKETLVMAGELMMKAAHKSGAEIIPVDSEHSAIFQSLVGHKKEEIKRIILTASGGPFLDMPVKELGKITPQAALAHPTWNMGAKVTIDSATLMNKGLEVIEARWLFNVSFGIIDVHIHPESIIHSMVEYCDGSVMAQLSLPDMRIPIAYALTYPERLPGITESPDFFKIGKLTFRRPDLEKFQCLSLAFEACRSGGTYPAVLSAANEVAVAAFLDNRISLVEIPGVIEKTMMSHQSILSGLELSDILEADAWARKYAEEQIQ